MADPDFGIFYLILASPCGILKEVLDNKQMLVDVIVTDGPLVMATMGNMITHYEYLRTQGSLIYIKKCCLTLSYSYILYVIVIYAHI